MTQNAQKETTENAEEKKKSPDGIINDDSTGQAPLDVEKTIQRGRQKTKDPGGIIRKDSTGQAKS